MSCSTKQVLPRSVTIAPPDDGGVCTAPAFNGRMDWQFRESCGQRLLSACASRSSPYERARYDARTSLPRARPSASRPSWCGLGNEDLLIRLSVIGSAASREDLSSAQPVGNPTT